MKNKWMKAIVILASLGTAVSLAGCTPASNDAESAGSGSAAGGVGSVTEPETQGSETVGGIGDPVKNSVVWTVEPSYEFSEMQEIEVVPITGQHQIMMLEGYPMNWLTMDGLPFYSEDGIIFVQKGKSGIINYEGEILYPATFRWTNYKFNDSCASIIFDPMFGLCAESDGAAGTTNAFSGDYRSVSTKEIYGWGLGDAVTLGYLDGQIVRREYPEGGAVENPFKANIILDVIDADNNDIGGVVLDEMGQVAAKWDWVNEGHCINGFQAVRKDGKKALVKAMTGELIGDGFDDVRYFEEGYCPVCKNGKWALIDETGKEVTDYIFDDVTALYQGKTFVAVNGVYGILNLKETLDREVPITEDTCYPYGVPERTAMSSPVAGTATVLVDGLNIRDTYYAGGKSLGKAVKGKTYDVYQIIFSENYFWYNIGDGQWIADTGTWCEYKEK